MRRSQAWGELAGGHFRQGPKCRLWGRKEAVMQNYRRPVYTKKAFGSEVQITLDTHA
jgi:hypothetical protein